MDESTLREKIARNLVYYRKLNGYTQADIAQKINYSDKSVSKWERGEGVPDVFVLTQLAELYQIPVGELMGVEGDPAIVPLSGQARTRHYVLILSVAIVWLVATVAYSLLCMLKPEGPHWWLAFVYAIPATGVVLTVLANVWNYTYRTRLIVSSFIVWGVALSLHLTFSHAINIWLIYIIAAVFQFVWIFWHKLIGHLFRRR